MQNTHIKIFIDGCHLVEPEGSQNFTPRFYSDADVEKEACGS
jgi:hypothetical protein